MKPTIKERTFTTVMVILATTVVMVLAALQYRWSNQVSEATSIRLADSLQMSMINWHLDLFRDFSEICIAMRADPGTDAQTGWKQYAKRFDEWKKVTSHPELVTGVYALKFNNASDPKNFRLDPKDAVFEPVALPPAILALRQELERLPSRPPATSPLASADQNASVPIVDREFADRFYAGGALAGWRFEPGVPALVRPVVRDEIAAADEQNAGGRVPDWMVIELNEKNIQDQILPELVERYFRGTEGLDYQVAVVGGNKPGKILYSSDPPFGEQEVADADGTMDIFGRLQNRISGSPIRIFHAPSDNKGPATSVGISWFPLVQEQPDDQDWRLVLRHRRGGALGAFVADSRRRDLAIGFGVLFLLVVSIGILIVTSMRAQRLAKLQMDFVTAVSHELRTPLTVMSSAADNIVHGVVEGKQQLEQYGAVIGGQAKKLFEMVEQILLFASIREGHQSYSLRSVEVPDILDAALSSTEGLIHDAGFRVERTVEPDLPAILGDLSALSQCLQNLITNALKYGSEQRWMGIDARLSEHGIAGKEIQISVSDRGIGIDPRELPHIFEPFYRSSSVMAAQIHGTGLGLPLAKSIVEAMNGQLTVKSTPGKGSTFTLHLSAIQHPVRHADTNATQTVAS